MARVVWLIFFLGALGLHVGPQGASGQDRTAPSARTGENVVNLFETLDPSSPIDGVRLNLPDGWTVREAHLFRYGTRPVPVQHRAGQRGTAVLTTGSSIQGPHELVVRVQGDDRSGTYQWSLTPLTKSPTQGSDSLRMRTAERLSREFQIEAPSRPSGPNRALDLTDAAAPLRLDVPASLAPSQDRSFTVEFWVQTIGLNQVILSSWTGDETTPYPLEVVTDQSGRLRYYTGRAGRHQALRSKKPVADGHWHHAAVIYDATESRLHLMLDGSMADSARVNALPTVSESLPLALGGRPTPARSGASANQPDTSSPERFAGRLDELRIWPTARAASTVRRLRTRPFAGPDPKAADGPLRLSFDDDSATERIDWSPGARRVPTTLSFRPPLRRLRAQTDGQSVTLRWEGQRVEQGQFVVERSPDGTSFRSIERLSPTNAAALSDAGQEFVYTDENVPGNIVFYRVRHVAPTSDTERSTGTIKIGLGGEPEAEKTVKLIRNFPNPFREATTIAYRVTEPQPLTLTIWDLSGKRVTTLTDGMHEPGYYEETLTAGDLPSGTYFARLQTPQGIQSLRMVLLK